MESENSLVSSAIADIKNNLSPLFSSNQLSKNKMTQRIKKNKQFSSILKKQTKKKMNNRFKSILDIARKLNIQNDITKRLEKKSKPSYHSKH